MAAARIVKTVLRSRFCEILDDQESICTGCYSLVGVVNDAGKDGMIILVKLSVVLVVLRLLRWSVLADLSNPINASSMKYDTVC